VREGERERERGAGGGLGANLSLSKQPAPTEREEEANSGQSDILSTFDPGENSWEFLQAQILQRLHLKTDTTPGYDGNVLESHFFCPKLCSRRASHALTVFN